MRNVPMLKVLVVLLPILTAVHFASADTAADMKEARKLYKAGKFAQAKQNLQNVINKVDPDIPKDLDRAFDARKKLPLVYLAMGQQPKAQAAVQQLLARHSNAERLPHALHEIVEKAKKLNRTLQAGRIYQDILAVQPKHPQAVWLKMGVAIANAHLNNDQAVDSTLQNIIAQHANDERATEALGQTAWAYRNLEKHDKARTVYQYVVDNLPRAERTIFSKRGVVLCSIAMGDEAAAESALQGLFVDFADDKYLTRSVAKIARDYSKQGHLDRARDLHRLVVENFPDSDEAISSQRDVIFCTLDLGENEEAQAATDALLSKFSTHRNAKDAIADVARGYRDLDMYEPARDLFKFNLDHFPESEKAINWLRAFVRQSAELEDDASINAGIKKLFTEFSENESMPAAAFRIGVKLYSKDHPRAAELLKYVIDNHPNHKAALNAKVYMGNLLVRRGQDGQAESIYQEVLRDHAKNPNLPEAIRLMAQGYYDRAALEDSQGLETEAKDHYRKAIAKWERAINEAPASATAAQAHWCSAVVHSQELGEYMEGIERYQKVVDNWPDYEYAWHAQFLIGKYFERLRNSGTLPESEANPRIENAYSKLIEKYPDSNSVPSAALKLGKMKFKSELWSDAILYFEKFVEREDGRTPKQVLRRVFNDLGHAYEQMGKPDMAAEMRGLAQESADPDFHRIQAGTLFQVGSSHYRQALEYKKQGHDEQAKDSFRKATVEWERVRAELPPSPEYSPRAHYITAVCYSQELSEHQKGAEYFQQIVDNWPDYKYARRAQFFVARNYELLKRSGDLPESEAEAKIERAYEAIVEKFPDSESVPHAAFALGSANFRKNHWQGSTRYFELFLQKDQGQAPTRVANVLRHLGYAYEKMGELDKAADKYRMFIEISKVLDPDDSHTKAVEAELERLEGAEQ